MFIIFNNNLPRQTLAHSHNPLQQQQVKLNFMKINWISKIIHVLFIF